MMQDPPFETQDSPQPAPRRSYTADDLGYPARSHGLLKNPLVATFVLLVSVGILVFVIMQFSGDKAAETPVIEDSVAGYKQEADDQGGMDIPHQESQIFAEMGDEQPEDLLAAVQENGEQMSDDLLAGARQVIEMSQTAEEKADADAKVAAAKAEIARLAKEAEVKAAQAIDDISEAIPSTETAAKEAAPQKPDTMHAAGSSPETLAFVQSVLSKTEDAYKKLEEGTAKEVAAKKDTFADLTHFVQLASIRDKSESDKQWLALQADYGEALYDVSYRVQEKNIEGRGLYYRIQAGPFTQVEARRRCDMIKQKNASGCFLVTK